MGDFAFADLTRPGGLYEHLADELCAGCGMPFKAEDRCYAEWDRIWHSGCWPKIVTAGPPMPWWAKGSYYSPNE